MRPYYEHGGITIYHGDCREILPHLPKVDAVITDPPYGIRADATAAKNKGKYGWKFHGDTAWDTERPEGALLRFIAALAPVAVIWGGTVLRARLAAS